MRNNFSDKVMEELEKRGTVMRPYWFFTLLSIVVGIFFILIFSFAVVSLGISLFKIREINPLSFFHLPESGWMISLGALPWEFILCALLALSLSWFLVRWYDLSYKISFYALFAILIVGFLAGSFILDYSKIFNFLDDNNFIHNILRHESFGDKWAYGEIIYLENNIIKVVTHSGNILEIKKDEKTKYFSNSKPGVGKKIRVIGKKEGDIFKAILIEVESK